MKKKSLSLFLAMSCLTVVCLVLFTIVTVFPPKSKNDPKEPNNEPEITSAVNEGNNKGSKDDPYYIYDTETFNTLLSEYGSKTKPVRTKVQEAVMEEITDEDGNKTQVEKKDENGNVVYIDKLDENGNVVYEDVEGETEVNHFKFLKDVDFSGKTYVTLFGSEKLIAEIDGNGKTVKNISISVSKNNLSDYIYLSKNEPKEYSARIAIFGSTEGAVIENISFENISVCVDSNVVSYLKDGDFNNDYNAVFKEFVVSSVIAYAKDTTLKANVSATVDSDAYAVYSKGSTSGVNGVGGVIAYAQNSTISSYSEADNATINVKVLTNDGNRGYYVGGVAGYLYKSNVSNLSVTASVVAVSAVDTSVSDNILYIGGVAGYTTGSNIENTLVNLDVKQIEEAHVNLKGVTSINSDLYNKIAGVVAIVRANNDTQLTNIKNVIVNSNVNMDGLFGGVVYEVKTNKYTATAVENETEEDRNTIFVTIEDVIANSNVYTVKAYGIGANLFYTDIKYTEGFEYATYKVSETKTANYNIKLTGTTLLETNDGIGVETPVVAVFVICSNLATNTIHISLKDVYVVYSEEIVFGFADSTRLSFAYGGSAQI